MNNYYSREFVLRILELAFLKTAKIDYAFKYTHSEEELRACVYRYLRDVLDLDERWRAFLSFSVKQDEETDKKHKPDIIILKGEPVHENLSVEIIVEMKNWPDYKHAKHDVGKLLEYRERFKKQNDKPELIFMAIVGEKFYEDEDKKIKDIIFEGRKKYSDVHIWLQYHNSIFCGPWNSEKNGNHKHPDPYLEKLRFLEEK